MTLPAATSDELLQQAIDRVWETIPPLWNQMRANVRGIARERFGISVEQFRILRHIGAGTGTVSALAAAILTSRPAVSQSVDALVEKGLVSRQQSVEDRRRVELSLTPSGREMLNAIFKENRRWMAQKLGSLSPAELDSISAGMQTLAGAFLA